MKKKRLYFNGVSFFIFFIFISYLFISKSVYLFHQFCPNSFICFFYFFIKKNIIVFKIGAVFFILVLLFAIVYRRRICSYACPVGFIYDLIYDRRKGKFSFFSFNQKLNKLSLIFSFFVLLAVVLVPLLLTNKLFFDRFCLIMLSANLIYGKFIIYSIIALLVLFVLSYFIPRFFCRFICPLGFLMGVVGYISHFFIKNKTISINAIDKCINCYQCEKNCPMFIKILEYREDINNISCIQCGECVHACPFFKINDM